MLVMHTRHQVFDSLIGLLTYPSRRQHGAYMFRIPKLEQLGMSQVPVDGVGKQRKGRSRRNIGHRLCQGRGEKKSMARYHTTMNARPHKMRIAAI